MITIEFPGMTIFCDTLPMTAQTLFCESYILIGDFAYHWSHCNEEKKDKVYIFEDYEWRLLSDEEVDDLDEIGADDLYPLRITIE